MRPRTITSTLIGVVFVLQLISLTVVVTSTHSLLDEQGRLSAVRYLDNSANNLVIQAQQFLSPITSQLSISRQLASDGMLNTYNNDTLERYFLSQLRSNRAMNAMYLGRLDGTFVAVARVRNALSPNYSKPVLRAKVVSLIDGSREVQWREYAMSGERLNQWSDDSDDFDPRVRAWYQDAQKHDGPVWTNAFSLTTNRTLAIAASVKLRDRNDADAGILGVSVELSELSALISTIPMSEHAVAIIMDNNLNKIAMSNTNETLAGEDTDTRALMGISLEPHDNSFHEQFLPPARQEEHVSLAQHWFTEHGSMAHFQRRIEMFNGALQWRVLLAAPVSDVQASNRDVMMRGMYSAIAIIATPGAIALLIILGLAKPLRRLYCRATIDYLTRAFNREEFINRLTRCLTLPSSIDSKKHKWVAVVLDLDGFKRINDLHGHDAGDAILKTVVARLQRCVGRSGIIGRLGGDEFAIALKISAASDAHLAVDRIRRLVVKEPIKIGQIFHHIGMTAGVAKVDSERESVVSILERADKALVTGKAIAKNATYSGVTASVKRLPVRVVPAVGEKRVVEVSEALHGTG